MAKDWSQRFAFWGSPPSKTEHEKCENAERAVRKAVAASDALRGKTIEIFAQGSFANGTNVPQDSDVDICVLYTAAFVPNYDHAPQLSNAALGFSNSVYTYQSFKADIENALVARFTRAAVRRGKKAFDIRENSYRINADVVPCFEHRLYFGDQSSYQYLSGTELRPDSGASITNWPRQNHANGIEKDNQTGAHFKAIVRILKNLRFAMIEAGDSSAAKIPSYLIECLMWNVPDPCLKWPSFQDCVRDSISHLWNKTKDDESCSNWFEINNIKYLFHSSQPWTRKQVNDFLLAAWRFLELP